MNLNENLVLPQKVLDEAYVASSKGLDLRSYPAELDAFEVKELRRELADYCKANTWKDIVPGTGGDQLLDLLCQFKLGRARPEGTIVTVKPTFSMYSINAIKAGGRVVELPLGSSSDKENPFKLDVLKIISACKAKNVKILALASPNNPTGIQYQKEDIKKILESISSKVLIILDEAYFEYGDYTAMDLLDSYDSLVILRTLSKAYGLASQRIGYAVTLNQELSEKLNNFQIPFPINSLGINIALELLKKKDIILGYARLTGRLRDNLADQFAQFDQRFIRVIPKSKGNFILVESRKARKIFTMLLERYKIAVKYMPQLEKGSDFLRITVGRESQNMYLLDSLRSLEKEI